MNRKILFARVALACALGFGAPLSQASAAESGACNLNGEFREIVLRVFGRALALNQTSFGIALIERHTGRILCEEYLQGNKNIYPASTIKTLIAVAILREVDAGKLSLSQKTTLSQSNAAQECVDWDCSVYGPGKVLTLSQLLQDMLTRSNNLATNQLIDIGGRAYITQTGKDLGAPSLGVYRKMYNYVDSEPQIQQHNTATAAGYIQLYREIATGRLGILSHSSRAFLIDLLRQQLYHDDLDKDFPPDTTFYHKTGETSQIVGDAGFYYLGGAQDSSAVAVLSGLENFTSFKQCSRGSCRAVSGGDGLAQVGIEALKLTHDKGPGFLR